MRVVRQFKSMIVLGVVAAALCVFAASASAAPTFSFSAASSSTQAAAPTDLTFTFASPSSERLTDIDFALPDGMMPNPSAAPVCASSLFNADRCPASSRVGTASAQLTTLGLNLTVPGTIFHVDAPGDAAATYGVILRPPLSGLGLIEKSRIGHRILFDDRGGITARSSGMPTRLSTVLGSVPTRVSRFTWRFDGMNASGNLLHNPTSCPANRPYRATASFSDGSTLSRTAPATTTGCQLVPLRANASVVVDQTGEQRTSFAILLDPDNRDERGALHSDHVKSVEADIESLGTFDTEMLSAMPACPVDVALSLRCTAASRVGSFSTSVEGLTGPLEGELHRSAESPTSITGVLDLPGDRIVGFKIEIDGVPITSKNIKLSIPSPLPLEQTVVKIDAPILKLRGKPSSCTNRETRMTIGGYSAGQRTWKPVFAGEPCPPVANFADAGDADADGDGLADKSLKPENFHVWYSVADGGNGVDPGSLRCELESPKPELAVRGKVKSVKDTGSGYVGCEVSEAAGDVTVVFSVASLDGHVTVLKSSYNIDSEAPVVSSVAPEPIESSSTTVVLPFEFTDDRLSHPQSSYDVECVIEDDAGRREYARPDRVELKREAGSGGGECMWDTGKSGRFMLEVVVRDGGGHVTVLKRTATVDAQGPTITLTDTRDQDDDGDGLPTEALRVSSFDIPFSVTDEGGVDPASVSCKLIVPVAMDKGLRVADLDGDGAPDVCIVADAPGGPVTVEISAADWRGHVTVLKLAYTIDTEAPVIETTAPDKVVYDISTFDYEFEFTDDTAKHPQSKFKAGAEVEIKLGVQSSSARIITDRDTGRSKGFARFENVPDGVHQLTLTVEDSTGHVTVLKHSITVDAEPPVVEVSEDLDSDGDGIFDAKFLTPDFEVPFSVTDIVGYDPASVKCTVRGWDYRVTTRSSRPDGSPDPTPDYWCVITDAPNGPFELEISAADWRGHVTVLKVSGQVDNTPPILTITSPFEGEVIPAGGMLTVGFDVVSDTAVSVRCAVDGIVIAPICLSGQTFTVTGMGAGGHVLSVEAEDEDGLTTTATRAFSVAAAPPPGDVCIAIYPPPEGCPGYIPPGTVICVADPIPRCYTVGTDPTIGIG